jgi:hypothetical protein
VPVLWFATFSHPEHWEVSTSIRSQLVEKIPKEEKNFFGFCWEDIDDIVLKGLGTGTVRDAIF